jgi:trimeric autotransporter adhesin
VFINNSTNNWISDTNILNNTLNGIFCLGSDNNTLIGNILSNNGFCGINITSSNNNTISNNIILNNDLDGIYLDCSSSLVNFNRIDGNTHYGLFNTGNGTINAENNWWGSNTLNSTSVYVNGGTVNCEKWLILNVTSSCDRSNRNGTNYNYIISADLTHNNLGVDTASGNGPSNGDTHNTLPDGIPVNFSTTIGSINTPTSTRNGKSVAILNSTIAGLSNVTVTLDNQILTLPINVTSINVLGIYNNRTGEGFNSIQSAIASINTWGGDILTLADGVYTENVVVYKTLDIMSVSGANVTVQAEDPYYGVFTIMNDGSTIQNLNIVGSTYSYGVVGYANNLNLIGNVITGNSNGISLFYSEGALISGNTITANWYGNVFYNSTDITVSGNNITDNWYGNAFYNSTDITVSGNDILRNWYGVFSNISNNTKISGNNITGSGLGLYFFDSSSSINENNITNNEEGISYENSNCIIFGNNLSNNMIVDISQMNSSGVVMQDNIWNCGPASLATVLNRLGINATQDELATLAGTDQTGTSMYGLVYASKVKGLNLTGMNLNVSYLAPNDIVVLATTNGFHFSVITSITSTIVFLADPVYGNINMTMGNFTALYTGYVLIITNSTNNNTQLGNSTILADKTMQNIKGTLLPIIPILIGVAAAGEVTLPEWAPWVYSFVVVGGIAYLSQTTDTTESENGTTPRFFNPTPTNTAPLSSYLSGRTYNTYNRYHHGYRTSYHYTDYTAPYIPPVYTYSYYAIAADGSYQLMTGTTTGNPDDIKNQNC